MSVGGSAVVDVERLRRDRRRSLRLGAEEGAPKPNVKVADAVEEYEAAFRLTYQTYLEMGYCGPHPAELRVLPHHLLPETLVFLARNERDLLGTVSLIVDSPFGLPADALYREDLAPFRDQGLRLGEVSSLAADSSYRFLLVAEDGKRRGVFWLLHQAVLAWAQRVGLDHLLITVNPRHAVFYERLYLFERFGEEKAYAAVQGAPAVPLHLDLRSLPGRLAASIEESGRAYDLSTFFFRLEHGFFDGARTGPGMPGPVARYFFARAGLEDLLSAPQVGELARALGYGSADAFLAEGPRGPG